MAGLERSVCAWLSPAATAPSRRAAATQASTTATAAARTAAGFRAASEIAEATPAMTALIEQFGPLGVFLLMVPESACIPVPSEVTLLFSGFAVSEHWMSLPLAIIAATAGNLVGSLIAYGIGAAHILERLPGSVRLLARSDRLLDEHELRAVFIARLLPLARTFVSLPAGARKVPLVRFIVLTASGCAIWAAGFVLVGVVSGTAWSAISSAFGKAVLAGCVLLVAIAATRRLSRRT
jgi:membrane protein DedA with SNARE-associated domain